MSANEKRRRTDTRDTSAPVMSTEEWMRMHLRRAPERDAEWVRRALVLQGRA